MSKATTKEDSKPESEKAEAKLKSCFIITPLGAANSDIRKKADGLINVVIEPILRDEGFHVMPPHKMLDAGSITVQIIQQLLNADLVVCNLTGLNPNVMYELAVRHATRKPVVCLYEKGPVSLPFDIAAERTIFYTDDIAGVDELRPVFRESVKAAMADPKPDNPIYRVATEEVIRVEKGDANFNSFVIDRLNELSKQMVRLRNNSNPYLEIDGNIPSDSGLRVVNFHFVIDTFSKISVSDFVTQFSVLPIRYLTVETVIPEGIDSTYISVTGTYSNDNNAGRIIEFMKEKYGWSIIKANTSRS